MTGTHRRIKFQRWDEVLPIPNLTKRESCILIVILSIGCYGISMDGDFVFDDSEAIVNNKDIKLSTPIASLFSNDFWGTSMLHNRSHKSYRPITTLSFRFNVWFANGSLLPYQFRLVNIVLHCVVCLTSVKVAELMMGSNCPKAANLCGVLFSVHPVHTEAIAGVVGRAELLCALFSFLSLIVYDRAVKCVSYTRSLLYTLLTILLVCLAMFSKEQGLTLLGICFIYDVWFVNRSTTRQSLIIFYNRIQKVLSKTNKQAQNGNTKNKFISNKHSDLLVIYIILLRCFLLSLSGVLLMKLRWKIMGGQPPTFQKVDNHSAFIDNFFIRVINYSYVYVLNAWLLLCPIWLCFDWSMGCVPTIDDFNDVRIIFVFLFWSITTLMLYQNFYYDENKVTNRNVMMAVLYIVVTFLPASNLFFTVGFVVAERVLYLPSLGFCIVITMGMQRLLEYFTTNMYKHRFICVRVVHIVFWLFVILSYSAHSIVRSNEWRTEKRLFESALSVCPLNAKVHYNLGKVAVNKSMSLNHYKQAIRLNPEYDQAMNNLANLLKDDGNLDEAEELLRKSLKLRPDFAAAWMNLGIVLSNKKQHSEAEYCFTEAIKFRKHYPDCYYNLGNLYLDQKLYNEAGNAWRKATSQKPSHSTAWNNLIIMLDSIGRYDEAQSAALEALFTLPTDAGLHFNLANTLGKLSRFEEAEKHFKIAIEINSNQALYYVNLGVLYHRWKKYKDAKEMYKNALHINPKLESAIRNLKMLP